MKFTWGTGITLFFLFFAVSMVSAVVATTKHPPQLVQKDYYALDLNYQEHLEKKQNAAALAAPPEVQFESTTQTIRITFPEGMIAAQGSANCYRSVTTRDDVSTAMENVSSLEIPAADFAPGRWHVALDWQTPDGKKYFRESAVMID